MIKTAALAVAERLAASVGIAIALVIALVFTHKIKHFDMITSFNTSLTSIHLIMIDLLT